jgi:small GTP-binding protein
MSGINLKILLVGDSAVGKTTLILKYVDGKFSDSHITTIGVEYKDKEITVNNRKINLQIWDTSGQERYRSITKNFYRNAHGILFVFDVTNQTSFDHLKDWLNSSNECDIDFKKIIVGNKIDLNDRVVNKETMEFFAEKNQIKKSYETSAKDGTNVDLIFKEMAELILANKTDEEINQEFLVRPHASSTLSKDSENLEPEKKKCC